MNRKKWSTVWNSAGIIASVAAFMLALFVAKDSTQAWIACSFFILFLIYVAIRVTFTINQLVKQTYVDGYAKLATHVHYICVDGKIVEYETQKIIQSKVPCLFKVKHGFKWSGTKPPEITSEYHEIVDTIKRNDKSEFDQVVIQLCEPLLYNQVGVVSIKMIIDDSDHKSEPRSSHKVEEPTQVISWRISLGGTNDRSHAPARLLKCSLHSKTGPKWEFLHNVPYHQVHRCYETRLLYPDFGYIYKLEWDRLGT